MSQWEDMVRGALYQGEDPALVALRRESLRLCQAYNALDPDRAEERQKLLRRLLGQVGDNCTICPNFFCDYGSNIRVGENFFANYNCVILDCAPVTFGDNVLVGPNCGFYTAGHPLDAAQRRSGAEYALPIAVGSDVWLGGGVTVLPGVTIGDGAVIAAGSVVTRDIPPGVVAAGVPCRPLRKIGPEDLLPEAEPVGPG